MISSSSSNMGHIGGSETRSIKENIVQTPEAAFLLWASWKFDRMLFWWYLVHVGIWVISGKIIHRSLCQMKENLVNTGGCIQNNCLDVFCIILHCIIKVSDPGPSWPSCLIIWHRKICTFVPVFYQQLGTWKKKKKVSEALL